MDGWMNSTEEEGQRNFSFRPFFFFFFFFSFCFYFPLTKLPADHSISPITRAGFPN